MPQDWLKNRMIAAQESEILTSTFLLGSSETFRAESGFSCVLCESDWPSEVLLWLVIMRLPKKQPPPEHRRLGTKGTMIPDALIPSLEDCRASSSQLKLGKAAKSWQTQQLARKTSSESPSLAIFLLWKNPPATRCKHKKKKVRSCRIYWSLSWKRDWLSWFVDYEPSSITISIQKPGYLK